MKDKRIYWVAAFSAIGGSLIALLTFGFIHQGAPTSAENEHYIKEINEHYRIFTYPLPEKADFAGEQVPLDQFDIRERFDRELLVNTYWQSNTLLSLKRSQRWFPVIEPILKEMGVPEDFKYLALIESGFTNVVSPSGATGFWQFLETTGKDYGLEINDEIDERYHVEKSTMAACHFLIDAHDRFGSWAMAAASYNMGMGGLDKQVQKQKGTSYWDLLLNDETSRYLFRILAVKEILNNADRYGFVLRPADLYAPLKYRTIALDSSIADFADYAKQFGVSYKTLKLFNPWLRQGYLKNASKKHYDLKMPDSVQ